MICRVLPPRPDPVAGFTTAYVAHAINLLQASEQQRVQVLLDDRSFRPAALANSSWETFFEPVIPKCSPKSALHVANKSDQWYRNLRLRSPYSVHQWQSQTEGKQVKYNEPWYRHQRSEGARMFQKYIRIRPEILARANHAFERLLGGRACISLHLRGTDKGDGRIKTNLSQAFDQVDRRLRSGNENAIFLATDDEGFLEAATKRYNNSTPLYYFPAVRTHGKLPTFKVHDPVQASMEVLRDIIAMSRCTYLVAGASSVSEMVMYINPQLHKSSVLVDYLR
jgi:hypothetical protein